MSLPSPPIGPHRTLTIEDLTAPERGLPLEYILTSSRELTAAMRSWRALLTLAAMDGLNGAAGRKLIDELAAGERVCVTSELAGELSRAWATTHARALEMAGSKLTVRLRADAAMVAEDIETQVALDTVVLVSDPVLVAELQRLSDFAGEGAFTAVGRYPAVLA